MFKKTYFWPPCKDEEWLSSRPGTFPIWDILNTASGVLKVTRKSIGILVYVSSIHGCSSRRKTRIEARSFFNSHKVPKFCPIIINQPRLASDHLSTPFSREATQFILSSHTWIDFSSLRGHLKSIRHPYQAILVLGRHKSAPTFPGDLI